MKKVSVLSSLFIYAAPLLAHAVVTQESFLRANVQRTRVQQAVSPAPSPNDWDVQPLPSLDDMEAALTDMSGIPSLDAGSLDAGYEELGSTEDSDITSSTSQLPTETSLPSTKRNDDAKEALAGDEYDVHGKNEKQENKAKNGGKLLLFVGVISTPRFSQRRAEIRASWMRDHAYLEGKVEAKFFIGNVDPADEVEGSTSAYDPSRLQEEFDTYQDMVRLDTTEGRDRLANKTLTYFNWVMKNRAHAKYVMKVDDDTYPRFERLLPIIQENLDNSKNANYAVMGHLHTCAWGEDVVRDGRYAEDPEVYKPSTFPMYPQGSGYIMSHDLAWKLFMQHFEKHAQYQIRNEDANVGLWIHGEKELGNLPGLQFMDLPSNIEGCNHDDVLSMNLRPNVMSCMYRNYILGNDNICCAGTRGETIDPRDNATLSHGKCKEVLLALRPATLSEASRSAI